MKIYTQEALDAAVLAERRRCADVCESTGKDKMSEFTTFDYAEGYMDACNNCMWNLLEAPSK